MMRYLLNRIKFHIPWADYNYAVDESWKMRMHYGRLRRFLKRNRVIEVYSITYLRDVDCDGNERKATWSDVLIDTVGKIRGRRHLFAFSVYSHVDLRGLPEDEVPVEGDEQLFVMDDHIDEDVIVRTAGKWLRIYYPEYDVEVKYTYRYD